MGWLRMAVVVVFSCVAVSAQSSFLGFDSNEYPGDANLTALRGTFSYAGFWLNNPPGERTNPWVGHRAAVDAAGLGFLVLYNGRLYAELKNVTNAARLGKWDAQRAVEAARREGFPKRTVIFLDEEQGGRMLPEQKAYIFAWVDGVAAAGFGTGVYCSGIPNKDDGNVVTAEDIREHGVDSAPGSAGRSVRATQTPAKQSLAKQTSATPRNITYWAFNDACPPSPGCSVAKDAPNPAKSGVPFAEVWQFAQSPRRKDVSAHCTNYSRDGNCYVPGLQVAVDLNAATSADPSRGRLH